MEKRRKKRKKRQQSAYSSRAKLLPGNNSLTTCILCSPLPLSRRGWFCLGEPFGLSKRKCRPPPDPPQPPPPRTPVLSILQLYFPWPKFAQQKNVFLQFFCTIMSLREKVQSRPARIAIRHFRESSRTNWCFQGHIFLSICFFVNHTGGIWARHLLNEYCYYCKRK